MSRAFNHLLLAGLLHEMGKPHNRGRKSRKKRERDSDDDIPVSRK